MAIKHAAKHYIVTKFKITCFQIPLTGFLFWPEVWSMFWTPDPILVCWISFVPSWCPIPRHRSIPAADTMAKTKKGPINDKKRGKVVFLSSVFRKQDQSKRSHSHPMFSIQRSIYPRSLFNFLPVSRLVTYIILSARSLIQVMLSHTFILCTPP